MDDTNNIITLNYYKGSETDVIVYANYVIGDKTYKTKFPNDVARYYSADVYAFMFNATSHPNMATEGVSLPNNAKIKSIKFSKKIDTSNMAYMGGMFNGCTALTSIEGLDAFDTSNVNNMSYMFSGCSSLTSLDLSDFDTGNVKNMEKMFRSCTKLTSLDLIGWDTSQVTNMVEMFSIGNLNSPLTTLDLSSFDTRNVKDMRYMFYYAANLTTIYVTEGKWDTSLAASTIISGSLKGAANMFDGCGTKSVTYK